MGQFSTRTRFNQALLHVLSVTFAIAGCDRDHLMAVSERPHPRAGQAGTAAAGTVNGAASGGAVTSGGVSSGGAVTSGGVSSGGAVTSGGISSGGAVTAGGVSSGGDVSATGGNSTIGSAPMACRSGGEPCSENSICCSGVCGADGVCPNHDGCLLIGERCGSHDACCSKACTDDGTGVKVCQAFDGCRPEGEVCVLNGKTWSGYCCSGNCVTDLTTEVSRCRPSGPANCLQTGEVCDASRPCCGRDPFAPPPLCYPNIVGVQRCLDTPPRECKVAGSPCRVGGECCVRSGGRHYCLPGDANVSTCSDSCAPIGARCFASRDCCTTGVPVACIDGLCQPSGVSCRQLGQDCLTSDDCCNKNCGSNPLTCIL